MGKPSFNRMVWSALSLSLTCRLWREAQACQFQTSTCHRMLRNFASHVLHRNSELCLPCLVINSCERIHSSSRRSRRILLSLQFITFHFPASPGKWSRSLALSLMHADTGLIATWGKRQQRGNAMTHWSLSHVAYMQILSRAVSHSLPKLLMMVQIKVLFF